MKPFHYYLAATASWFAAFGIHQVLFAWLLTIHLLESAERVGYAQMVITAPATLFVLLAGILADKYGGRRIAILFQILAVLASVLLIALLLAGQLSYTSLLLYALLLGIAQAFVIPARDGLINIVAPGNIQRAVVLASLMQFSLQILGFTAAAYADQTGPVILLAAQAVILIFGIWSLAKIKEPPHKAQLTPQETEEPLVRRLYNLLMEGGQIVFRSPVMRAVLLVNCAMGMFFMGSYIVTLPLLVRDVYDGSSSDLALLNGVNSLGLVVTILLLVWIGDLKRPGLALVATQLVGGFCLAACGLQLPFVALLVLIFAWGACGGIAISMSRALMQALAPINMRSRVMSFYVFSFVGSGPIGALLSGFLSEYFGAAVALIISSLAMVVVVILTIIFTGLTRASIQSAAAEAA